jgi:ABC-2 type transport system permease protein
MKPFIIVAAVAVFAALRLTFRYRRRRARASTPSQPQLPTSPQPPRRSLLVSLFGVVGLVAQREVRERIRGRVFQVGTAIILLVVIAAIVIPVLTRSTSEPEQVGVVGTLSAPLRTAVMASADEIGTTMTLLLESDASDADADLRSGKLDLVIVDAKQVVVAEGISAGDTSTTAQLAGAIAQTLGSAAAFQAAGLTASQVDAISNARPVTILGLQPATAGHKRTHSAASVITLVLVFVMLSQYSTWILTGVVEEKTSRVVEVLLAAVRPAQLLGGKVLGIGLVAAAQAALLVAVALGLSEAVGSDLLHGTGPLTVLVALVWLVLGYAFYCWVYAAAGSTVERQEQVQSLAFPLTIPVLVGYISSLTVATTGTPNTFVDVLAYLPPTAPFAMPTLVSIGAATWWEFTISVVLSLACTVAMARFATSIYRRAILRTGRRVRIRELRSAKPS